MLNLAGLSLDNRNIKGQGWAWAKNIVMTKGFRSIANENGFQVDGNVAGIILGVITTNTGKVIFSRDGDICAITVEEGGVYTLICKDSNTIKILNFQWDCPIEGAFKYNWKGDLIVSWWDGNKSNSNRPRLLNLTNLPFPVNGSMEFISTAAQNLMLLNPDVGLPSFILTGSSKGGNIDAGVYYLVASYEVAENDALNWMLPSHPFPIGKINNDSFVLVTDNGNDFKVSNTYQESNAGDDSGLSVDITISDIDTRFKYIKLAAIKEVNKQKTAIYIDKFLITGSTIDFTWTGKFKETLSIDEVLIDTVSYKKAKTGTYNNNRLCLGNLTTQEDIRYQKFANNIGISWATQSLEDLAQANKVPNNIIQTTYKKYEYFADPGNAIRVRTAKPNEVYAIYIHLVYKDGTISKGFHIPGREKQTITIGSTDFDEDETVTNAVAAEPAEFGADEALLGTDDNAKLFHTRDTANITHPVSGKYMGYWENEDEVYPNIDEYDGTTDYNGDPIAGGIDLRGQKVRHHRMPSIRTMYGGTSFANLNKVLKTLVLHNIQIPIDIEPLIQGVMISYAEKNLDNSLVLGSSPVYREAMYGTDTTLNGPDLNGFYTPGNVISNAHARLYDIPLLDQKPNVNARYLKAEYISTNVNVPVALGNPPGPVLTGPGLTGVPDTTGTTWVADNLAYRVIKKFEYIPENNSATIPISNNTREACVRATFALVNTDILSRYRVRRGFDFANDQGDELNYPGSDHDEVKVNIFMFAVAHVMNMVKNVHNNFYDQKLIMASRGVHQVTAGINSVGNFFTFDTFVTGYSIKHNFYSEAGTTYYPANATWENDLSNCTHVDGDEALENTHIINTALGLHFRFPCYSNYNYVFNRGNDFEQIPVHMLMGSGKKILGFNDPNKWSTDIDYDLSYSSVMDMKWPGAWSPYDEFITKLPYRVARADETQSEEKQESWRLFRANEYHEGKKDKGEVWKLDSLDKVLLIHQKHSLYVAMNKDKLNTNITEVFVGSGDVFDREPQAVMPTPEGYAGNQSQWASFVCKLGYVFADRKEGKVFLFNGALKEISNQNVRNWMWSNLNTNLDIDNPFTEVGLTAAFDEQFNRLLLGKTDIIFNEGIEYHGTQDPGGDEDLIGDAFLVNGTIQILTGITPIYDIIFVVEDEMEVLVGYSYTYRDLIENHLEDDVMVGDFQYKRWTLSYSPDINEGQGGWVSYHDYYPNYMFNNRTGLYSVKNNGQIFKHNDSSVKAIYYDGVTVYSSYFDMIHNEHPDITKIIESVTWQSEVELTGTRFFDETITHIMVYNTDQCTGTIALQDINWFNRNNRNAEGHWNFNDIRDKVIDKDIAILDDDRQVNTVNITTTKSWFKKDNLLGKFIVIRYIYDNVAQKDFYFHDSKPNFLENFR